MPIVRFPSKITFCSKVSPFSNCITNDKQLQLSICLNIFRPNQGSVINLAFNENQEPIKSLPRYKLSMIVCIPITRLVHVVQSMLNNAGISLFKDTTVFHRSEVKIPEEATKDPL